VTLPLYHVRVVENELVCLVRIDWILRFLTRGTGGRRGSHDVLGTLLVHSIDRSVEAGTVG
jgi:hypothetical protein